MTHRFVFFTLLSLVFGGPVRGQSDAQRRAASLQLGANLSYLENYWSGQRSRHFGDHVDFREVQNKRAAFFQIKATGLESVRIPVNFSAWASMEPPYDWDFPQNLAAVDSFLVWARQAGLRAIIDLHHPELDGSFPTANTLPRKRAIWERIARRYAGTDPDWVLFELQNEPHGITAAAWRVEAEALLTTVRALAPRHTLVIGAEEWNGRDALIRSLPFADPNLIYTFHFYDPFVFTHQGAEWVDGMRDVKAVPFPSDGKSLPVPASVRGTWIENALTNYTRDGQPGVLIRALEAAKAWGEQYRVPIFLGEFGAYSRFADTDSRCRHLTTILSTCGVLGMPATFWEWDQGFSLFAPNSSVVLPCMREALKSYTLGATGLDPPRQGRVPLAPNPTDGLVRLGTDGGPYRRVEVLDASGRRVLEVRGEAVEVLDVQTLPAGVYLVRTDDGQVRRLVRR